MTTRRTFLKGLAAVVAAALPVARSMAAAKPVKVEKPAHWEVVLSYKSQPGCDDPKLIRVKYRPVTLSDEGDVVDEGEWDERGVDADYSSPAIIEWNRFVDQNPEWIRWAAEENCIRLTGKPSL